jgi:hypothetical protein
MSAKVEPEGPGIEPAEETRMRDCERLAQMPLESLLYYVLVGEGRREEAVEG